MGRPLDSHPWFHRPSQTKFSYYPSYASGLEWAPTPGTEQDFRRYPANVVRSSNKYTTEKILDALQKAKRDYLVPVIRIQTQQVSTGTWFDVMHLTPASRKQRRRARDLVEGLRALGLYAMMRIENDDA